MMINKSLVKDFLINIFIIVLTLISINMIKIYYLRNKNNEIFYVGKTKNSLPIRIKST